MLGSFLNSSRVCIRIPCDSVSLSGRDSVFGSCVILRNSAVAGNRPESPAGIYIYPGGLEGVRVRINRFIPVPIVVRIWHLTVSCIFESFSSSRHRGHALDRLEREALHPVIQMHARLHVIINAREGVSTRRSFPSD